MNIDNLSATERETLKRRIKEAERAEKARIETERRTYKDLVDATVNEQVAELEHVGRLLKHAKKQVFEAFETVAEMKSELFEIREKQQTHTFTSRDGLAQITLGYRVNEGWDDTAETGIAKVKKFLKTLAKDENSSALVETILRLLSRDGKGNLKASKILELDKLAARIDDRELIDAIKIIKEAYRPRPTRRFVEVNTRNDTSQPWTNVPLSISAVDHEPEPTPEQR